MEILKLFLNSKLSVNLKVIESVTIFSIYNLTSLHKKEKTAREIKNSRCIFLASIYEFLQAKFENHFPILQKLPS